MNCLDLLDVTEIAAKEKSRSPQGDRHLVDSKD
jgi:hypothetical protein